MNLPPRLQDEVADFIDFLSERVDARRLTDAAGQAAVPSFAKVWNNDEDAAYDAL